MDKSKVVCLGEALIDRIKNKSNQGSTDFLGGAPANVACALSKLKINSAFIGRLGSDEFGEKFIELARKVYKFNDERAKIKLAINNSLGSNIKEVKSYE